MSPSMTKPTKWPVHPGKTQISLGICPVWSESSLSAWKNMGSLATHWVHSEDCDRTGWMPRLIWVFAECTGHIVRFVRLRLKYDYPCCSTRVQIVVTSSLKKWKRKISRVSAFLAYLIGISTWLTGARWWLLTPGGVRRLSWLTSGYLTTVFDIISCQTCQGLR